MSRTFDRKHHDESTLTTLCPRCLNAFRNTRGIRVRLCQTLSAPPRALHLLPDQLGYDYYIQPPARKPPILRKDGSMMNLNALKVDPEFQARFHR